MNHAESVLQSKIVFALSALGVFLFSVPNELAGGGAGAARKMAQFKAMGLRAGISDLILMGDNGVAHFMEVKTPTGKLSEHQVKFWNLCVKRGWPYTVVRTVAEAVDYAKVWGLV